MLDGDWFDREFDLALKELEPKSSVGISAFRHYGTTIGDVLGGTSDGVVYTYDPAKVDLLRALVSHRLEHPEDPDPIRVFVKHEPHKQAKIDEGRLRLISAVSLVDAVADRVMFGKFARNVVSRVGRTPVMIGWSPLRGGSRYVTGVFRGREVRPIDMSAWDWTVDGKMIRALEKLVLAFHTCAPAEFEAWLGRRFKALFTDAVFQFGNGLTIKQPGTGLMKSGCYLTLILNSLAQELLHYQVLENLGMADMDHLTMGDDRTLVNFARYDEYVKETLELGYLIKESEPSREVTFCGFKFFDGISIPEYVQKHLFVIQHTNEEKLMDILSSYQILYTHNDLMLKWIWKIMAKRDASAIRPLFELRAIYNG